jgi:hypothetical protein
MASETEHCGQKHIRWAEDFLRGLIPTVCANNIDGYRFMPYPQFPITAQTKHILQDNLPVSIVGRYN